MYRLYWYFLHLNIINSDAEKQWNDPSYMEDKVTYSCNDIFILLN